MPTKYSLTVHVDERWVKEWGGDNSPMKFCYGGGMGSEVTLNVVAYTTEVAATINVEWTNDYYIAASKHTHENGVDITSSTNYEPIQFGEKFTVDRSWADSSTSQSPLAPDNGFLFQNVDTPASAVIAQKINGKLSPIYISPFLLPPSGTKGGDKLYPANQCAVWFDMNVYAGTMVENDISLKYVVDMDQPSKTVTFGKDGSWSTAAAS